MALGKDFDVLNLLVTHYGNRDEWVTDHLKHYRAMEMCIAVYINENIMGDYLNYTNEFLKQPKEYMDLSSEKVQSSSSRLKNINLNSTPDEVESELKTIREELLFAKLVLEKADNIISTAKAGDPRNDWLEKKVGRPSHRGWFYEYLNYLSSELGSHNKAINYVVESPIYKSKNSETLKREYRKYRNAQKGEG